MKNQMKIISLLIAVIIVAFTFLLYYYNHLSVTGFSIAIIICAMVWIVSFAYEDIDLED